jgi:hypothetical protein
MKARRFGYSFLILAFTLAAAARPASGAPAEQPKAAAGCRSIAVDLTDPATVALLQNAQATQPVGEIRVTENGQGADRMRSAAQDFEVTSDDQPAIKLTITCTSGPCAGFGCAVVGCNPIMVRGEPACNGCSCVPIPPALLCTPNACTCTKTSVVTPATPTQPGSEETPEP